MITDVLIKNFKCLKNLTVPDFGRINLIGGKNNVGKTSLLEALFLFHDRERSDKFLRQLGWRGMIEVPPNYESTCSSFFFDNDLNQDILISIKSNEYSGELRIFLNSSYIPPNIKFVESVTELPNEQAVSTKSSSIHSIDIEYISGDQKGICHHFTANDGRPATLTEGNQLPALPAYFFASKTYSPNLEIVKFFSEVARYGREEELIKIIKIIEPRLESLKILTIGASPYVHGKLKGVKNPMPINLMGEGLVKLLHITSAIMSCEKSCLFIDEIENGMHYSVLSDIWKTIGKIACKYDCQIIITTHSYECLKAAHKGLSEMPDDFRYIRLHRKDNEISAKLSNYDMIGTAIETNQEVR